MQKATPPEIQGHPKPRKGGSGPFGTPGRGLSHFLCAPTLTKVDLWNHMLDGLVSGFEKPCLAISERPINYGVCDILRTAISGPGFAPERRVRTS